MTTTLTTTLTANSKTATKASPKANPPAPAKKARTPVKAAQPRTAPADELPALDIDTDPLFPTHEQWQQEFEQDWQKLWYEDPRKHQLWADADPALRQAIAQVGRWYVDDCGGNILRRYALGELVLRVQRDDLEHRGRVYGGGAVEKICKFFDWDDSSTTQQALRLAVAFNRAEIEDLARARMANGRPLTYRHLYHLVQVPDADRPALIERVLAESLTTGDMVPLLPGSPKKQPDGETRGRPLKAPKDLDALLRQQGRSADDFLKRDREVWRQPAFALSALVQGLAYDQRTAERAAQLQEHAEQLERLADAARGRAQEARQAHDQFVALLKTREGQTATAAVESED